MFTRLHLEAENVNLRTRLFATKITRVEPDILIVSWMLTDWNKSNGAIKRKYSKPQNHEDHLRGFKCVLYMCVFQMEICYSPTGALKRNRYKHVCERQREGEIERERYFAGHNLLFSAIHHSGYSIC